MSAFWSYRLLFLWCCGFNSGNTTTFSSVSLVSNWQTMQFTPGLLPNNKRPFQQNKDLFAPLTVHTCENQRRVVGIYKAKTSENNLIKIPRWTRQIERRCERQKKGCIKRSRQNNEPQIHKILNSMSKVEKKDRVTLILNERAEYTGGGWPVKVPALPRATSRRADWLLWSWCSAFFICALNASAS